MWKLIDPLLEGMRKNPLGAELLIAVGVLTAALSVALYFVRDPAAWQLASSEKSIAFCVAVFGIWGASLLWRKGRPSDFPRLVFLDPTPDGVRTGFSSFEPTASLGRRGLSYRIAACAVVATALATSAMLILRSTPSQVVVRLYFDHESNIPGTQKILEMLNADGLFKVEAIDKALNIPVQSDGRVLVEDALAAALFEESKHKQGMLPVIVTTKRASFREWQQILAMPTSEGVVLSTYFAAANSEESPRVQRYLATSIALEALNARYMMARDAGTLPVPREQDVTKGCLNDFRKRDPAAFVEAAQSPELCPEERLMLSKALGEPTVRALETTLLRISEYNNQPPQTKP